MRTSLQQGATPTRWTWADAATRTAQSVSASDLYAVGLQTDMNLQYQLIQVSPARWAPLPDLAYGPERAYATVTAGTPVGVGLNFATVVGTTGARTLSNTSIATRLVRTAQTTSSSAGNAGCWASTSGTGPYLFGGGRFRMAGVLGAVSSSMRWFMGLIVTPPSTNVDVAAQVNLIGIGRSSSESNVQVYYNDASGTASQADLGASFPAGTVNIGYELELYSVDGTGWTYGVKHLDTFAEISGVVASNLPATATQTRLAWYSSNNADAVAVSLDFVYAKYWQRVI